MTTAMRAIKYTNEGIHFINSHEEEWKTNEQITSNHNQYEFQKPFEMNTENKRKRKQNFQIGPQKYHKNNLSSYKYHDDIKKKRYYRNRSYSDLEPKQPSQECESINEDHIQNKKYKPENTDIDNSVHENHVITTVQPQKNKTPISLINEWAMRGDGACEKKTLVSYTLVAITGHAHRPMYTYMCRVNDKTAKGEGQSKKEAKQNAAAQMWEKLFKISSTTNYDKVITSTTITDNFEVNENDATNFTSSEGSQIIYETDSNIEDEELLQHSNYDMVKIAHCNMNPVGALQELSTAYKWTPPFYNFEKLGPQNKDNQNGVYKTVFYKVTCKVFHLQTTETACTKKEAKRLAARRMFDQIRNIGEEKLNALKSLEFKNDCEIKQEENQKLPLKWNSSLSFQSYFIAAISKGMNTVTDSSASYFQFESNKNEEEMNIKTEYQQELEQAIVQFNPNLSAIDLLHTVSQQLNFQVTYMCVNDMDSQQQIKNNNGPDKEYTVLIQVTTVPVIVTMGQAKSLYGAAEVAASSILHTFQNLLIYTSFSLIKNQNNDEQVGQSTMANH